jgi:predicted transcriptional regulator
MKLKGPDMGFLGTFYHAHSYALSYALSQLLGSTQAVFMSEYARNLQEILAKGGDKYSELLNDIESFIDVLKDKKVVEEMRVEELDKNRVKLIVKGCALASSAHSTLNLIGSRHYLCPIATMAMVVLAKERGLKRGEDIFNYIKFDGSLSYLTQNGSETTFIIVKK